MCSPPRSFLLLVITSMGLLGCAKQSPEPAQVMSFAAAPFTALAIDVPAGQIIGSRTARGSDGQPVQCWSYVWQPDVAVQLAAERNLRLDDALRFEVNESATEPYQLGALVIQVSYESSIQVTGSENVRSQCFAFAGSGVWSHTADVVVRWELFSSTERKVVYSTETRGRGTGDFDTALGEAIWAARDRLADDEGFLTYFDQ